MRKNKQEKQSNIHAISQFATIEFSENQYKETNPKNIKSKFTLKKSLKFKLPVIRQIAR